MHPSCESSKQTRAKHMPFSHLMLLPYNRGWDGKGVNGTRTSIAGFCRYARHSIALRQRSLCKGTHAMDTKQELLENRQASKVPKREIVSTAVPILVCRAMITGTDDAG